MQTFETSGPIAVTVELGVGSVRIAADDRADTVVDVRPSDPSKRSDVIAAEQTTVEYANGRLQVRTPKGWRQWSRWRGHESIDVRIDVPTDSSLSVDAGVATIISTGRVGESRFRTGVGDIHLEEAAAAEVKIGAGDAIVERIDGTAEVATGSGAVRISTAGGRTVVKNGNGETWIGEVTGEARINAANGRISVDRAHTGVVAKSANGNVRLGEVERGAVVAQTSFGSVEVGIRDRVAAWLDLDTKFGGVQNELEDAGRPGANEDSVEVHAQTSMGDISIRRAVGTGAGKEGA